MFNVGDSIIKHLDESVIDVKTGNYNAYVRSSHSTKIRCMVDLIKPVTCNKPDHNIFHFGTKQHPIREIKYAEDIVISLVELALLAKFPIFDIAILNNITRKNKHQYKFMKRINI